jgi:hypothetical protein
VTSDGLSTNSLTALLTVHDPGIVKQPEGQVAGPGLVVYQWYRSDAGKAFLPLTETGALSGTGSDTLVFNPVTYDDSGLYRIEVADEFDTILSNEAALNVVEMVSAAGLPALAALSIVLACAGCLLIRIRRNRFRFRRYLNR